MNPRIIKYAKNRYGVCYTRKSGKTIHWLQGGISKCMKDPGFVSHPPVIFFSQDEAEKETRKEVIPYLLKEKGVDQEEIIGWEEV